MTHTYALLRVSPATYQEIARKLRDAGYHYGYRGPADWFHKVLAKRLVSC